MPGRYQNEDRDDYYNEPYRERDYEARGRYSDDNDERYASRREPNRERESDRYRQRTEGQSKGSYASGGQHRGKGPKGYTRSDDRIKEDVSDALMEDAELDASDIEVTVKKGEVTLQGQVGNRQDKRRAEECAEMCAGVVDVQNNIKIRSATSASSKGTA